MDAAETSDDNTNFTYCDDLTYSNLEVSDDDEPNLDPLLRNWRFFFCALL
jgi:hypothetical protein